MRSSPTWSQFPKMGTGIGPGGSLKRLPRSLEMKIAPIMATKMPKRVFSKRRRSMAVYRRLITVVVVVVELPKKCV